MKFTLPLLCFAAAQATASAITPNNAPIKNNWSNNKKVWFFGQLNAYEPEHAAKIAFCVKKDLNLNPDLFRIKVVPASSHFGWRGYDRHAVIHPIQDIEGRQCYTADFRTPELVYFWTKFRSFKFALMLERKWWTNKLIAKSDVKFKLDASLSTSDENLERYQQQLNDELDIVYSENPQAAKCLWALGARSEEDDIPGSPRSPFESDQDRHERYNRGFVQALEEKDVPLASKYYQRGVSLDYNEYQALKKVVELNRAEMLERFDLSQLDLEMRNQLLVTALDNDAEETAMLLLQQGAEVAQAKSVEHIQTLCKMNVLNSVLDKGMKMTSEDAIQATFLCFAQYNDAEMVARLLDVKALKALVENVKNPKVQDQTVVAGGESAARGGSCEALEVILDSNKRKYRGRRNEPKDLGKQWMDICMDVKSALSAELEPEQGAEPEE